MNYRMTVGTEGNEIAVRVDYVPRSELGDRSYMVNFYVACSNSPVAITHLETTTFAARTVDRDCCCPIATITFIAVGLDSSERALGISG